jgi:phosphoglycerate dehydrogenase-like enzyme
MTHRVLVLDDYQDVCRRFGPWQQLSDVAGGPYELDVRTEHLTDDALAAALSGAEIVVAMRERTLFSREILSHAPGLKLLVTTGMANAAIDLDACRELGIEVRGTTGLRMSTAELTWGLILALARHICVEDRDVREGGWQRTLGFELAGARLGVVGLGKLGGEVAKIGLAFGMDVVAWSQNLQAEHAIELGVRAVAKDELFATSDVITLHLRLSDRTRGIVGADELAAMRHTAYLINTSRGPLIDEDALIEALRTDSIAGAGLDVFDVEPLPAQHPLRTLPNTVVTPHVGYVTTGTYERWWPQVVENIKSWASGEAVRVL